MEINIWWLFYTDENYSIKINGMKEKLGEFLSLKVRKK